ncbi:hypothetical protein E2562_013838 [Oryza meyeriana var. granulata]|uniref:F-box domain-containing protein n=1 Tax=Oryza meyeriana var. granulata TaxID=110450 RepID=A0A6G1F879_9ORYZ|nr:hypothetical protein E2562_013838 [Oryza meyeriana var. granulata]
MACPHLTLRLRHLRRLLAAPPLSSLAAALSAKSYSPPLNPNSAPQPRQWHLPILPTRRLYSTTHVVLPTNLQDERFAALSDRIYDAVIETAAGSSEGTEAALDGLGSELTTPLVADVLHRLRYDEKLAFRFFVWASHQDGYEHEAATYNDVIDILSGTRYKARQFGVLCDVLDHMKRHRTRSVPVEDLLGILRAYTEKHLTHLRKLAKKRRVRMRTPPETDALNVLLDGFCKCGMVREAEAVFSRVKRKLLGNAETYSILFFGWCRARDPKRAMKVLEEMIEMKHNPENFTYNAAIDSFCSAGLISEARELFEFMRTEGSTISSPTAKTYSIMIVALAKDGKMEECFELISEMRKCGCMPDVICYAIEHFGYHPSRSRDEVLKLRPHKQMGECNCSRSWSSSEVLENVLESVLEFLTAARDRNAASLVCRSWYRAEAQTRQELFIGNCYAVSPRRAVERFGGVRAVVLKGKPRFADFSLVPYGWGAYVSPWVAALGPAYPRLERICLKRMTVSNDDLRLIAKSFPLFKELSLVCCDGFSTQGLATIAERCRHLRVLDLIEDCIDDEEDELVDWISKFPESNTSLESLVFDCVRVPFNFEALEALVARSPALCRLRMNHHVTVEQLRRLMAKAPQLTHLGTGAFRSEPGPGGALSVTELATSFAASRSLICLSGFRDVNPEYLPAIHPVCANLTSLNFSFANLTAEEITPIIRNCVRLRTFWVLDTVGDEGLRAVAETCSDLRELRVFPFDPTEDSEGSVSDVGLQAISEGCRKLESILYFCQRMTNAAVIAMSKNCPDLVTFRLCIMGRHRPDWITGEPMDDGFGAIVMNCKKLTRLSVSGLLTDKAFAYIGKYGKLIKTLSVAFAGNSDMSLQSVFEGCTRLQKLEANHDRL